MLGFGRVIKKLFPAVFISGYRHREVEKEQGITLNHNTNWRSEWLTSNPGRFFKPLYSELADYSDEYIENIFDGPGNIIKNGALYNDDYHSKYVNVSNGMRHTTGQPSTYENDVYILGPSWCYGFGTEDKHTIASQLQQQLNEKVPNHYRVNNLGVRGAPLWNSLLHLEHLDLYAGQIVILLLHADEPGDRVKAILGAISEKCAATGTKFFTFLAPSIARITSPSEHELILESHSFENLINHEIKPEKYQPHPIAYSQPNILVASLRAGLVMYDLQPLVNRPHEMGEIFFDAGHWNYKLNQKIADIITSFLEPRESTDSKAALEFGIRCLMDTVTRRYHQNSQIAKWLQITKESSGFSVSHNIGCIVMNANPFTLGHLHLIERALEEMDSLYVFVVEENESTFSFKDRLYMVQQGVKHLDKPVAVLPSGQFIISSFTFPGYFTKETKRVKVDSTFDALLFASVIAPELNITHRFLGDEPHCPVTSLYNSTLSKYLMTAGIKLIVIPRISSHNGIISASAVRHFLKNNELMNLKYYVPESTFDFLVKQQSEREREREREREASSRPKNRLLILHSLKSSRRRLIFSRPARVTFASPSRLLGGEAAGGGNVLPFGALNCIMSKLTNRTAAAERRCKEPHAHPHPQSSGSRGCPYLPGDGGWL
jgi:cytidyltransferase-like protein